MAKKLTMALVVVMLIVGFGIGLVASPFLLAQNNSSNNSSTDTTCASIQKTGVINVGTDPKLATLRTA